MSDQTPLPPSETEEDLKPWTVKAVPQRARDIAAVAARRDNLTIGQWLTRTIAQAPSGSVQESHSRELIPAAPRSPQPARDIATDAQTLSVLATTVSLANERNMPRALARSFHAAVRRQLREMRGTPPLAK